MGTRLAQEIVETPDLGSGARVLGKLGMSLELLNRRFQIGAALEELRPPGLSLPFLAVEDRAYLSGGDIVGSYEVLDGSAIRSQLLQRTFDLLLRSTHPLQVGFLTRRLNRNRRGLLVTPAAT